MISFPTPSVAPSIITQFVNGVKFDICEVCSESYGMLNDKKFRYFLCVEDTHIVQFASAEKFCNATGENRWDMFCKSLGECKALISKFDDAYNRIIQLEEKANKSKGLKFSCLQRIQTIKTNCINTYGIYPSI